MQPPRNGILSVTGEGKKMNENVEGGHKSKTTVQIQLLIIDYSTVAEQITLPEYVRVEHIVKKENSIQLSVLCK